MENRRIQGLIPLQVEDGLSILQYADDIVLFLEHNLKKVKNIYSFGKGTTIRKKYRPIAWDIICLPKDRGVRNLEFRNTK
ncbi:hypothetical protein U9M48_002774 [Paspalum notatum var. saurae]|uniref:Uncharacterized protein n=1 Tax=Paspalum notatum var. saurae TaxID=547442 RepID=A0AAQ3PRN0_PASNO